MLSSSLKALMILSSFDRTGWYPSDSESKDHPSPLLQDVCVNDFTRDWADGLVLCQLVVNLGGVVAGWPNLSMDPQHWVRNLNLGIAAGRQLGVEPILSGEWAGEKGGGCFLMIRFRSKIDAFNTVQDLWSHLTINTFVMWRPWHLLGLDWE